jgi:uncharacterized protein YjiS (DUF1127 family)
MNSSTVRSHAHRTDLYTSSWWAGLRKSVRRLFAWIRYQRQSRCDINRLMEFDDQMLADIGLSRAEILHAVRYGRLRE